MCITLHLLLNMPNLKYRLIRTLYIKLSTQNAWRRQMIIYPHIQGQGGKCNYFILGFEFVYNIF